eukprot:533881-Pleurochrysis_carterae.AAC.1
MPSSSLRCPAGQNGLRSIVTESGLCKMTLFQYEAHRAPQPDDVFSACIVIECRMARAKSRSGIRCYEMGAAKTAPAMSSLVTIVREEQLVPRFVARYVHDCTARRFRWSMNTCAKI